MGWYYTHGASRRDIIDEITRENSNDEGSFRTLRKCFRGNTMYALHESGKHGEPRKWIGVYLLQRGSKECPGWGYKPMDESMEPYFYECPVSYLDAADEPISETARRWRAKVRERAAQRTSKKPKVGELWSLVGCLIESVVITSVRPLRGTHGGTTYRIKRSLLGHPILSDARNNDAVIMVTQV
jgi:hypothetical protein